MKTKLQNLTKLQRHWALAECLGIDGIKNKSTLTILVKGHGDGLKGYEMIEWNPDLDKSLIWDLWSKLNDDLWWTIQRINQTTFNICRQNFDDSVFWDKKIKAKTREEAIQLAYIYSKLGNEVEVPEGLE